MAVHSLEIVSNDVETLTALYQRMHGIKRGQGGEGGSASRSLR